MRSVFLGYGFVVGVEDVGKSLRASWTAMFPSLQEPWQDLVRGRQIVLKL